MLVRLDYWSVMLDLTVEQKISLEEKMNRDLDYLGSADDEERKGTHFSIRPLSGSRYGDYRHTPFLVSVAGAGTNNLVYWNGVLLVPPTRVDFRIQKRIDPDGLKTYRQFYSFYPHSKSNLTVYDNKSRKKTDTRDRGGIGMAIGSLRSDIRSSIYVPAGFPGNGAIEVQLRSEKATDWGMRLLETFIEREQGSVDRIQAFRVWQDCVQDIGLQAVNSVLEKHHGFEAGEMFDVLNPRTAHHQYVKDQLLRAIVEKNISRQMELPLE